QSQAASTKRRNVLAFQKLWHETKMKNKMDRHSHHHLESEEQLVVKTYMIDYLIIVSMKNEQLHRCIKSCPMELVGRWLMHRPVSSSEIKLEKISYSLQCRHHVHEVVIGRVLWTQTLVLRDFKHFGPNIVQSDYNFMPLIKKWLVVTEIESCWPLPFFDMNVGDETKQRMVDSLKEAQNGNRARRQWLSLKGVDDIP
ncbi:hypothetical protein Hamer_G006379, partial [Homarus americanus]